MAIADGKTYECEYEEFKAKIIIHLIATSLWMVLCGLNQFTNFFVNLTFQIVYVYKFELQHSPNSLTPFT
jgi:hypothetical protein